MQYNTIQTCRCDLLWNSQIIVIVVIVAFPNPDEPIISKEGLFVRAVVEYMELRRMETGHIH